MNDIEKSYDTLMEEFNEKVEKATRLLEEASVIFQQAPENKFDKPRDYDNFDDLRRAMKGFLPTNETAGWNTSSWCVYPDDD